MINFIKTIIATAALLFSGVISFAQATIKPGDKELHYDWIKPAHDFYRNIVTDTAGKVLYDFVMDDYTFIDPKTKQITFARSRQVPAGSFSTDTSVTDLFFKPIRMHEIHYQRNVTLDMTFGDTQASVKTNRKGVETSKTYLMKAGYFEDNMIEYLFGFLDLKKGIVYTMDDFNNGMPNPSDPYTVEYAFDDTWTFPAGRTVECTVLHFTHGKDTSGYMWVDNASHKVVKTIARFKLGKYVLTLV